MTQHQWRRRAQWLVVVFSCTLSPLFAQEEVQLQHVFRGMHDYRVIITDDQRIDVNGVTVREAQIVTRTRYSPREGDQNEWRYALHHVISEEGRLPGQPVGIKREENGKITVTPRGEVVVPADQPLPSVRGIPFFPSTPVAPGAQWSAPAIEVHDLSLAYGIDDLLRIPVEVNYTYLGRRQWRSRIVEVVRATYRFTHTLQLDEILFPREIRGESYRTIYWDARFGRERGGEEQYWIEFDLSDGRQVIYHGNATTEFVPASPLDRESVIAEIQRRLNEAGIENTMLRDDPDGIALVIEQIGFPPDSAVLLDDERRRLPNHR